MRVGKGCERCRTRHIRCVIPPGASACTPCSRLDRACHLDPRFQFKAVHHVYQKSKGAPARFELVWDEEQVWVDVSRPVTFVLETNDVITENDNSGESAFLSQYDRENLHELYMEDVDKTGAGRFAIHENRYRPNPTSGPLSLPSGDEQTLSLREASLMRYFIQKLAPWADICDLQSHFSTEVPRRALQSSMVLKAILALSARHDAILSGASDWEASAYHGQCLELLIVALDQAELSCDENMLIAVVILRIYEELENNTDQQFHLLGSNKLVNLVARSASSGGLAEAVSWQFLRQAIYASIVQYQPLQLDMQNYERSAMFHRHDDAACANVIIYHCARIIQVCSEAPGRLVDREAWRSISESVNEWKQTKPLTWQPLRYQAPDVSANQPFPELWMISPPAVVGMQYYYSACIFLTLCDTPPHHMSDYDIACSRRIKEKSIADNLVMVIGLSLSNESVENAYFMASHLLHRFGYCLRHPVEQQGSLDFMCRVEKVLGWRTSWMRKELESRWTKLAAFDSRDF
ncbi:uncharacterized protein N7511_007484 [Penicillium nucicola]|uniref:uncharacterized protein n=1 Tax=Penicillium nucicola TaxID=1850975 RepID=UPI00254506B3|nr:uncharacterized protein N7511_007484 [Penicillium nucicola]KAJ5753331.1 hypothetical protein N7511_007484 [Penicillium nucicola]